MDLGGIDLAKQNITFVRGDTFSFGVEIDGLEQDLDTAFFTCKQNYTDEENAFQKSLGNGITKLADGKYIVRVAPEDTASLKAGKYFYDFQISVNTDVFTVLYGVLELEQDVTF